MTFRGEEAFDRLVSCPSEGNRRWAPNAPVLVLSVAKTFYEGGGKPNRHAFHEVGMAVVAGIRAMSTPPG